MPNFLKSRISLFLFLLLPAQLEVAAVNRHLLRATDGFHCQRLNAFNLLSSSNHSLFCHSSTFLHTLYMFPSLSIICYSYSLKMSFQDILTICFILYHSNTESKDRLLIISFPDCCKKTQGSASVIE